MPSSETFIPLVARIVVCNRVFKEMKWKIHWKNSNFFPTSNKRMELELKKMAFWQQNPKITKNKSEK